MAEVETVTGPVPAEQLGLTLVHEHVRFRDEAVAEQWPHLYDRDAELAAAVEAVNAAKAHGVRTICDPTAMFGGRDVRFMREVSERTGVQIVACTGIYTYDHLPMFFRTRDVDAIAELFVRDISEGIQGTDIKAAFIKCAADEPGVNENVEKIHRAAARASRATGVPIMAHTRPASNTGPRQLEILLEEGVAPGKVQLAHTGDSDDLDYIVPLLEQGVYVGLDRYGLEMFLPLERRNETLLALVERGYVDRLLVSQDFCATIDWFPPEAVEQLVAGGAVSPDWSMVLVFEKVLPALRERGLSAEDERRIFVDNPRRWLTGERLS